MPWRWAGARCSLPHLPHRRPRRPRRSPAREIRAPRAIAATPRLYQPNGARCDGENCSLSLLATTSGGLVALPPGQRGPRLDARGREPVAIFTGCGIARVDLVEGSYALVGGVLGGPDGPPPGWNAPYQRGWATRDGEQVVYTDDAGHRETFRFDADLELQPTCG